MVVRCQNLVSAFAGGAPGVLRSTAEVSLDTEKDGKKERGWTGETSHRRDWRALLFFFFPRTSLFLWVGQTDESRSLPVVVIAESMVDSAIGHIHLPLIAVQMAVVPTR